jgi:hypothetical protein
MILHICVYDSASVQDLFYGMGMFLPEGARIIMNNNIIYIYIYSLEVLDRKSMIHSVTFQFSQMIRLFPEVAEGKTIRHLRFKS